MELLNAVNRYMTMFFWTLFVVMGVLGAILYYFLKIRKVQAKEEKINYSRFERRDSLEYVKFDDIYMETPGNISSAGMVIIDKYNFVAGLEITGFYYHDASAAEQQSAMINMISLLQIVKEPIQLRQTVTTNDLSHNIQVYEEKAKELSCELIALDEEYQETLVLAEDYLDQQEVYDAYTKRLDELQRVIVTKKHSLEETNMMVRYMNAIGGRDAKSYRKIFQVMFSYTFNPDEYTEELSRKEIYEKAMAELSLKEASFAAAFARCGCTTKRLTADDLTMLMYQMMSPKKSVGVKMSDLFNSSYNSLFVTSDSLEKLEKTRRSDEEYQEMLERYQEMQEEILKQQRMEAERNERAIREQLTSASA